MEQLIVFKTADGTIFEDKILAEQHELKLKTKQGYYDNPIYVDDYVVNYDALFLWIDNNADLIIEYLRISHTSALLAPCSVEPA